MVRLLKKEEFVEEADVVVEAKKVDDVGVVDDGAVIGARVPRWASPQPHRMCSDVSVSAWLSLAWRGGADRRQEPKHIDSNGGVRPSQSQPLPAPSPPQPRSVPSRRKGELLKHIFFVILLIYDTIWTSNTQQVPRLCESAGVGMYGVCARKMHRGVGGGGGGGGWEEVAAQRPEGSHL